MLNTIYLISLLVTLILLLSLLLLVLGSILSKKNKSDREFQSPFECGFSTFQDYRLKFSLHFFLVALVFIIFDVELILLFPFYSENLSLKSLSAILVFMLFLLMLTLGLVNEWNQLVLEWAK